MKVFISHSSHDRWVARKISEDLLRLGVGTFLDEKDIETGESIDVSVHTNLKKCDDFLVILSSASLHSHWVLIEIGGALALEKRVVPILLHVAMNAIPQPLSKRLARDINEINKYYEELKLRLVGAAVAATLPQVTQRRDPLRKLTFEVGDKVRIVSRPQSSRDDIGWSGFMDRYCNASCLITAVNDDRTAFLDIDSGEWRWAFEWLVPTAQSDQ